MYSLEIYMGKLKNLVRIVLLAGWGLSPIATLGGIVYYPFNKDLS